MADAHTHQREGMLAGALPCFLVCQPALRSLARPAQGRGARRSYLLTVTEGAWDDWYAAVAVMDERGLTIAHGARDDQPLDVLLSHMLTEVDEAIVEDFVARRVSPGWVEEQRRALICRLAWARNLRRRYQRHRNKKARGRAAGRNR